MAPHMPSAPLEGWPQASLMHISCSPEGDRAGWDRRALVVNFPASVVLNMARSQSICPKPKSCHTDCSELWFPVVCGSGTRSLMHKPEPFLPTAKSQNTPCYRRCEEMAHNWFYQPGTLLNLNRVGSVRWIPPSSFWLSVPTSVECL